MSAPEIQDFAEVSSSKSCPKSGNSSSEKEEFERNELLMTPKRISLTPISKNLFDISALFAKKKEDNAESNGKSERDSNSFSDNSAGRSNSDSLDESTRRSYESNEKEQTRGDNKESNEKVMAQMDKIHSFAKVVLEKAAEIVLEKDIELLEQRSFYLAKAKELSNRVQELLRENILLKEIQQELDRSAEKISIFRSDTKSLSICSYLYDSWRNRECKSDLQAKYLAKSLAYDELLMKYTDLESDYFCTMQMHQPMMEIPEAKINSQCTLAGRKRGRKPKINYAESENLQVIEIEPKLSKRLQQQEQQQKEQLKSNQSIAATKYNREEPKKPVEVQSQRKAMTPSQQVLGRVLVEKSSNLAHQKNFDGVVAAVIPSSKQLIHLDMLFEKAPQSSSKAEAAAATFITTVSKQTKISKPIPSLPVVRLYSTSSLSKQDSDMESKNSASNSKREIIKNKLISKQKKKQTMSENQDTTFNSIEDTLFF